VGTNLIRSWPLGFVFRLSDSIEHDFRISSRQCDLVWFAQRVTICVSFADFSLWRMGIVWTKNG